MLNWILKYFKNSIEDIETLWWDNMFMEEFIPSENKTFLTSEFKSINSNNGNKYGYEKIHKITKPTVSLLERSITYKDFETKLLSLGFEKCRKIKIDKETVNSYVKSGTKILKFKSLKIYFNIENQLIEKLGIKIGLIVSTVEFEEIKNILASISKDYDLILVDWFCTQTIDFRNEKQSIEYLMVMFK